MVSDVHGSCLSGSYVLDGPRPMAIFELLDYIVNEVWQFAVSVGDIL